jgi:hypothetical protein
MHFLRFGLFFLLIFRIPVLLTKLWRRFDGAPLRIGAHTIEFRVHRSRKTRTIAGVSLGVRLSDKVRFSIHPETTFDRFCKAIGLAEEWQTKDEAFDRDVFIICDDMVLLRALSRSEPMRKAVLDLVGRGGTLHCSRGHLWVDLRTSGDKDLEDRIIAQAAAGPVLSALLRVRDEIHAIASSDWREERDSAMGRQRGLLFFTLLCGALGAIALFFFHESRRPPRQMVVDAITERGVWTAAICGLVLITLTVFLLRATSRLHWVLLDVLLVGVPGIYLVAHGVAIWQNQHFDTSAGSEQLVEVSSKHIVKGRKNRRTYYITVQSWPDPRADRRIKVHSDFYESLSPPTCVRVRWHPGAYGDPWVSEMVPVPDGCDWNVEK